VKRLLRALFVVNIRNKVTALVLAAAIWLVVSFEVSGEYERSDVMVEVVPMKDGTVMKDIAVDPPRIIVKATFEAPQRVGQQYLAPAAKVRAVYRIENPPIGEPVPIKLSREDFDLPYDVRLKQVKPKSFSVVLRRIVTRQLRVQVRTLGQPAQGYELADEPQAEPTEVSVRGPKEVLDAADVISTEPVDVEGRSSSFSSDYELAGSLSETPVEVSTNVRVRVNIRPVQVVRTLRLPVRVNTPPAFQHEVVLPRIAEGGRAEFQIKGPALLLDDPATPEKLSAFVVITPEMQAREGIPYSVPAHLFLLPELKELRLAGEHLIEVEIREKKPSTEAPSPK
jgi:hypothetical protein